MLGTEAKVRFTPTASKEALRPDQILPRLTEYLGTSVWSRDQYSSHLLTLNPKERAILGGVGPTRKVTNRVAIARAKHELQAVASCPIGDLSEVAQSYLLLNALFGENWTKLESTKRSLINFGLSEQLRRAAFYDEQLTLSWRAAPVLMIVPPETAKVRMEHFDDHLGPDWRKNAFMIPLRQIENVDKRIEFYDRFFGDIWRKHLSILQNSERTVISSTKGLATIGITLGNTEPYEYFLLLATTMKLKRKKARLIRTGMGHKHIRVHEDKKELAELVSARLKMTDEEKAQERKEIQEFSAIVRNDPKLLFQSIRNIQATRMSDVEVVITAGDIAMLAEKAREGDNEAFSKLVKGTMKATLKLATRWVINEADAEDVAQEAYLRAFRGIGNFRGNSDFKTWLHTIVVNCARNKLNEKRFSQANIPDPDMETDSFVDNAPANELDAKVDVMAIRAALPRLPKTARAVVELLLENPDLSTGEIASILGLEVPAARARVQNARRILQANLFLDE